jgi:hypothetical protein
MLEKTTYPLASRINNMKIILEIAFLFEVFFSEKGLKIEICRIELAAVPRGCRWYWNLGDLLSARGRESLRKGGFCSNRIQDGYKTGRRLYTSYFKGLLCLCIPKNIKNTKA